MSKKKERKIDLNDLTPEEACKLEIAEEIGVYDKVLEGGWRVLSAKESGRIGGILSKRKRARETGSAERKREISRIGNTGRKTGLMRCESRIDEAGIKRYNKNIHKNTRG